ncbi:Kinesin-like protein KIN-7O [Vitis vinifera]|uniref:Kinesin-like protein KIN-7O n=1 Tax=Vitis vinifera TaxID=29760 RepID=A0A438I626_VITVI|nr:Kinesin-like protein KIN-7O [Vitis vinifera]
MERINVTVRARPLSPEDAKTSPWRISGNSIAFSNHSSKFDFDRIFGEDCKTAEVYQTCTKDIVVAAVRGFNDNGLSLSPPSFLPCLVGTVFAYGQTNSGKTHTMRGSATEPGVIPLAVHDLFDIIQEAHIALCMPPMLLTCISSLDRVKVEATSFLCSMPTPHVIGHIASHHGSLPMVALARVTCCNDTMLLSSSLGAAMSHGIVSMTPLICAQYAQGIVPFATTNNGIEPVTLQATSHKTLRPCAIIGRGDNRDLCHYDHGLHTIICHGAYVWVPTRLAPCALLMLEILH